MYKRQDLQRSDLKTYCALLASLPPVRACGFLSGRQELLHWIRSDLFQFYYDTLPLYGDLSALQKLFTKADVAQAIHLGACNLYHAACHSYVFDQTADALPALFKTPFFLLQAKVFLQTGRYVPTQRALLDMLQGQERLILQDCIDRRTLPGRNEQQRDACMERLLQWTSGLIRGYAPHI